MSYLNDSPRLRRYSDHIPAGPAVLLITAVVYLALAQYIVILNDPVALGAGFWPAAGFTLGMLMLLPIRHWPWVISGVAAGELGGNFAQGYPLVANLFWTLGNCVGPLLGALLLRRWASASGKLVPVSNLLGFFAFGVVIGPLAGATVGTLGSALSVGNPFWQVWPMYVVGDALGALVVAPVLLTWSEARIPRSWMETALLVAGLVAVNMIAFRNWPGAWDVVMPYLIVPILTWAALRYGVYGAAWAIFFTANFANVATAFGFGPFALFAEESSQAITLLQVFLLIVASATLVLATLVNDLVARVQAEAVFKHEALHDSLTGLYNRRALDTALAREIQRAENRNAPLAVVMFDIDDFKACNDVYGHAVGDNILQQLAQVVSVQLRAGDVLARWGGEEFMALLPGTDLQGAGLIAERIRSAVKNARVDGPGRIHVSVGVTEYRVGESVADLSGRVDGAVYKAKDRGGNAVQAV